MTLSSVTRTDEDTYVPSVGVVVLTWENYSDTAECLRSLRSLDYPEYEVIVVDNGSTDGSRERLLEEFEWCEFVLNDENRGFARGNNPGIERALSKGHDYVLLLNNDTIVNANSLTPLVETAEEHDDVVAVGGVQYRADAEGDDEILNAGSRFFPYLGGRISPHMEMKAETPYEVSYVMTSYILVDSEFIRQNDILHEGYFLGMDDIDLAVQARQNDKQVMINPEATIQHKEGLTQGRSPFKNYHWVRNRLQFASERLPPHQRVIFYIGLLITLLQFTLSWIVKGRTELISSTLIAVFDYLADRNFRSYEFFSV